MASLQDILSKTQTGSLYKTSEEESEELQSLSRAAGRQAPPINPAAAATIGASPDVAKMAGTRTQKIKSLQQAAGLQPLEAQRVAPPPAATLSERLRTGEAAGNASPYKDLAEARAIEAKSLQGLSFLEKQVEQLKTVKLQEALTKARNTPVAELAKFSGETTKQLQRDIKTLLQNPQDAAALVDANKLLGRDASNLLTAQELIDLSGLGSKAIVGQVQAEVTEPKLKDLSTKQLQEMGYASLQDLERILGRTGLGDLTFTQFGQLLGQELETEYRTVEELRGMLADPSLGNAERIEIRKQLAGLGAAGLEDTESQFASLVDKVNAATLVQWRGQLVPISEALADEEVAKVVEEYVNGDAQTKDEIATAEPDIAQLVEEHEGALTQVVDELKEGAVAEVADIQAERRDVGKLGNTGAKIDDRILEYLLPGFRDLGVESLGSALSKKSPFLAQLVNNPNWDPVDAQQVVQALSQIYESGNRQVLDRVLKHMDLGTWKKLGFLDRDPAKLNEFLNETLPKYTMAQKAVAEDRIRKERREGNLNVDYIAQVLGFENAKQAGAAVKRAKLMAGSGLFDSSGISDLLPYFQLSSISPSGIDWVRTIANLRRVLDKTFKITDIAQGSWRRTFDSGEALSGFVQARDSDPLYQQVEPYVGDGKIDRYEAQKLKPQLTWDSIQAFPGSTVWQIFSPEARKEFYDAAVPVVLQQLSGGAISPLNNSQLHRDSDAIDKVLQWIGEKKEAGELQGAAEQILTHYQYKLMEARSKLPFKRDKNLDISLNIGGGGGSFDIGPVDIGPVTGIWDGTVDWSPAGSSGGTTSAQEAANGILGQFMNIDLPDWAQALGGGGSYGSF